MLNINLDRPSQKIHFIGIGGISMSGLAEIMHERGHIITGSDMKASANTKHLEELGMTIYTNHGQDHITSDLDLVVYTAAISKDNPELVKAQALGLHLLSRSEFLGLLMKTYQIPICVAGTHGKTTTTSMLSDILVAADLDPTISVGGILKSIGGNIRIGSSNYFLTEACEYCDSFLNFFPKVGIILNVEADHLDYFKDEKHIHDSFVRFSKLIPSDGFLAINGQTAHLDTFYKEAVCAIETFGLDETCDWYATNIVFNEKACASFDTYYKGEFYRHFTLGVPGVHNVYNTLSICATSNFLGIDPLIIERVLPLFTGPNQRFELKGSIHDVTIIDDYAHHPTEIEATLNVANAFPKKELYIVFQPHTYTRTKALLDDFVRVLSKAPHVIVTDIYAAREVDPGDIHSTHLVTKLQALGKDAIYISDFGEIADHLLCQCSPGDVIITMGAGNINQVADILLGK